MSNPKPPSADITVAYDQFHLSAMMGWVETNGYKPYLLIATDYPGVRLPPQSMTKHMEVINVHSKACAKIKFEDIHMEVTARFGSQSFVMHIPYHSILSISFAGTDTAVVMPWVALNKKPSTDNVVKEVAVTQPDVGGHLLDTAFKTQPYTIPLGGPLSITSPATQGGGRDAADHHPAPPEGGKGKVDRKHLRVVH